MARFVLGQAAGGSYVGGTDQLGFGPINYRSAGPAATGTTETSLAFATPAAALAGDLLVVGIAYQTPTTSDIANTAAAGWTKIGTEQFDVATTTGVHLVIAVKAAVGGAENHTWTLASAGTTWAIRCHAYANAATASPFDQQAYNPEPGPSTTTTHTTTTGPARGCTPAGRTGWPWRR